MTLAVSLLPNQVEVATSLLNRIPRSFDTDDTLVAVARQFPNFDRVSTLLKAAAINQLYWTHVYAIGAAAHHVTRVMAERPTIEFQLVERLANVPKAPHHKYAKRYISFASKFAHFFVSETLPIYDWYAATMVRWHLGQAAGKGNPSAPYITFADNVARLRQASGITCSVRELDRYLWLAGQLCEYRKTGPGAIGADVRALIESQTDADVRELAELVPMLF